METIDIRETVQSVRLIDGPKISKPFVVIKTNRREISDNLSSFKIALKNSFLIESLDAPVLSVLRDMRGAVVSGQVSILNAGDTYEATEYSAAVISGKAKVGDPLIAKNNSCRPAVGTFLEIQMPDRYLDRVEAAQAIATRTVAQKIDSLFAVDSTESESEVPTETEEANEAAQSAASEVLKGAKAGSKVKS